MLGNFSLHNKGTMRARALPLAKALARRGHEVTLAMAALDAPWAAGETAVEGGVRVVHIAQQGPAGFRQLSTVGALLRLALAAKPDVVHAFKPIAYAGGVGSLLWALPKVGTNRARLVFDADDWEGTGGWVELDRRPAWQRWVVNRQERWNLSHCAALTVASRHLATLAWAMGAPPQRVHYLPNGAEAVCGAIDDATRRRARSKLGLGEGPVVLLYTRFAEYPVSAVVDLLRHLTELRPETRLLIVGRGLHGEERDLARQLAQSSLERRAVLAGWIEPPDLPTYFAAADVAVYPFADTLVNRTKCPAKLVELLAAGLPVVSENVGQTGEYIVHGESGLLIPPGDIPAFATAVAGLLGDSTRRRELAEGAATRIGRWFLWDQLAERAELAYGLLPRDGADGRPAHA